jgi:uncharacterized protein CbrC (UPF0167 family)
MDVDDNTLIIGLIARDGPLLERTRSHLSTGECRYVDKVNDRPCPWCEAERRRQAAEAAKS